MDLDNVGLKMLEFLAEGPRSRTELVRSAPSARTGKRRLEAMLKYRFVIRVKQGQYALSSKGRERLNQAVSPVKSSGSGGLLEKIISLLPTEACRACIRLTLSGIVAKRHLLKVFDDQWPATLLLGPTKTAKTSLIKIICRVIGVALNILYLGVASRGEISFRRRKNNAQRYDLDPSRYFNEPVFGIDEFDKADPEIRKTALLFVDGRREFMVEGKKVVNHAYSIVTANPKPHESVFPEPYLRRSVVCNTQHVKDAADDIDLVMKGIFDFLDALQGPIVDLEKIKPKVTKLPAKLYRLMRDLFMNNVAENHKGLVDTQPLEILTLGRAALFGYDDLERAVFETVWDRLLCLETMGGTQPDWRKRLTEFAGKTSWGTGLVGQAEEPTETATVKKAGQAKDPADGSAQAEVEKTRHLLVFKREKADLLSQLRVIRETLPRDRAVQDQCAPVRDQVNTLMRKVKAAKSSATIQGYQEFLPEIRGEAKTLLDKIKAKPEAKGKKAEDKPDSATAILKGMLKNFIVRQELKDGEDVVEKLLGLGCIVKRYPSAGNLPVSLIVELLAKGRFLSTNEVVFYFQGVDGKLCLPEDLNTWDRARPLLVEKLKQLESGAAPSKEKELEEERAKDISDAILADPQKWPLWFKTRYQAELEKDAASRLNAEFENRLTARLQEEVKKMDSEYTRRVENEVSLQLNHEFDRRVSTGVEKELRTQVEPKIAALKKALLQNPFGVLAGPYAVTCDKCGQTFRDARLNPSGLRQLLQFGSVVIPCPDPQCLDILGRHGIRLTLEGLIAFWILQR